MSAVIRYVGGPLDGTLQEVERPLPTIGCLTGNHVAFGDDPMAFTEHVYDRDQHPAPDGAYRAVYRGTRQLEEP